MANRGVGWDNVVALSYAAEQLFMAAQLLTSDTIPRNLAVQQTCNRYLRSLLTHEELLPPYIVTWTRECQRQCDRLRNVGSMTPDDIQQLTASVNSLLDDVRQVLKNVGDEAGGERAA